MQGNEVLPLLPPWSLALQEHPPTLRSGLILFKALSCHEYLVKTPAGWGWGEAWCKAFTICEFTICMWKFYYVERLVEGALDLSPEDFIYLCVHVPMQVGVHTCIVSVWKLEDNFECHFSCAFHVFAWDRVSQWSGTSLCRPGWLAQELPRICASPPLSHHLWDYRYVLLWPDFDLVSWTQNFELRFSILTKQVLYRLGHLVGP